MPHHSWAGTPRDHRLASPRLPRRTLAVLFTGCLAATACTGEDERSSVAAQPTDPSGPTASVTSVAVTEPTAVRPSSTTTEPPPTTSPAPPRCGDDVEPSGPVTITVWHGLSGDADEIYIDDVTERFETSHPGITVELMKADLNSPGGVADLFAPGVDTPDVVLGTNLTVRDQAESGAFVPVVECAGGSVPAQFEDLLPVVDTTYRVSGTLWAAPYNVSTPLLMYDGNVWAAAGVDPDDPPETIDEMLDIARDLDESGVVDTGLVLYDKSALWLITETAGKAGRLIIEPDNGHDGATIGTIRIINDDTVALVDELRSMKQEGVIFWAGVNADNRVDLSKLVAPTERSGMTLHTSASLGDIFRLQEAELIPPVDVRVAPLPGPGEGAAAGGGAWWLLDGADPDRVAAGWRFIDWMTQPERIADLAAYTGYVPSTPTAASLPVTQASWEQHPQYRVAFEQVAATPGTFAAAGIQIGPMTDTLRAIELGLADAIDANQEPRTSMEDAVKSIDSIVLAYEAGRP